VTPVSANFMVTAATLTVTANAGETKTYGQGVGGVVLPGTPFTVAGLVNGDTFNGEGRGSAGDVATANAGNYDVTTSGGSGTLNATSAALPGGTFANDYNINYATTTGGLTVNPAALTVAVNSGGSSTYGSTPTDPGIGVTAGTLFNGDTVGGIGLGDDFALTAASNAGPYTINVTGVAGVTNYNVTPVSAGFTINKAALTVAVNGGGSSTYGGTPTDPGIGVTAGTLFNGDTLAGVGLADDFALTAASNAGPYTINVTGAAGVTNYNVTPVSAGFTINKAALTVAVNGGGSSPYGTTPTDPGIGVTAGSLFNGDTLAGIGLADDFSLTSASSAGPYTINVTGAGSPVNYMVTPVSAIYNITKAALTVAVNSGGSSTYGSTPADPGIGVTAGALVNGDTFGGLGLGDDFALTAASNAGPYTINVTGVAGVTNYTVTPVSAGFTINKAALTVAVNSGGSSTYGSTPTDPGIGVTAGTLFNGDTLAGIGLADNFSLTSTSSAGPYTINVTGAGGPVNYNVTPVSATYNITKAALTVAVNSGGSSTYGSTPADPGIGVTAGALVNGDTLGGLGLGDDFALTAASNAGPYTINVTGVAGVTNYTVTPVSAGFTINKAALTVAVNSGGSSTYGGTPTDPGIGVTAGTLFNGDTLGGIGLGDDFALTAASNAGPYTINVTGVAGVTNYNVTPVSAGFTINKAALTVAVNSGGSSTYGSTPADPGIGVTAGSLFNGDTLGGIGLGDDFALTAASNAGPYTVNVTGATTPLNYNVTPVSATFTINQAPLIVTANNASQPYTGIPYSGGNGVTYGGFVNGQNASVLQGALFYTGTSQGAVNAGNYLITPGGLDAVNYALNFQSGTLSITPVTPPSPTLPPQIVSIIDSVISSTANLPIPTTTDLGLTPPALGLAIVFADDSPLTGGAINNGSGGGGGDYIAIGSSTSGAPALYRVLTSGSGPNIIFNGVVSWANPPSNILTEFQDIFSAAIQSELLSAASNAGFTGATGSAPPGEVLLLTPGGGIMVIDNGTVTSGPIPANILQQFNLIFNSTTQGNLQDASTGTH